MGFLEDLGETLQFVDSEQFQGDLRKDAIVQMLYLTKKYMNYNYHQMLQNINPQKNIEEHSSCDSEKSNNQLIIYWGDEIESHLIQFDDENKKVRIQPNKKLLRDKMEQSGQDFTFQVHDEYGSWMLETVPNKAYPTLCRYGDLIGNIRERTSQVKQYLGDNQYQLFIPSFPGLGVGDYFEPIDGDNDKTQKNNVTKSLYIDDRIINPHPRFPTLTENIRNRRQEKVNIQVPLFIDENTDVTPHEKEPYSGKIHMDAMAFGMGSCCLQTTFSAIDFEHARWLYDQLSILSPLFLALTAGSPIFKGKLADIDTRWDIIAASVDDRKPEERDPQSEKYIPKSRYDSASFFISSDERNFDEYNDYDFPVNEEIIEFGKQVAKEVGVEFDEKMWKHIGFLFMRDALVIFKNDIKQDNQKKTAHFENIQSTNWNSVRLKLPPSFSSHIGWRVEFRTTEVQLTDDENAAISMLVHIFVRMLYEDWFTLNMYIPMSLVQENFQRSRKKNALLTEKFYFRTNLHDNGKPEVAEMTIYEIFFGCEAHNYKGLYHLYQECINDWNNMRDCKLFCCQAHVERVFDFIRKRCSGEIKTLAAYQRDFVVNHPEYKKDSIVSERIQYDLCKKLVDITYGNIEDPNFPKIFPESIFHKKPAGFQTNSSDLKLKEGFIQQQQQGEEEEEEDAKIQQCDDCQEQCECKKELKSNRTANTSKEGSENGESYIHQQQQEMFTAIQNVEKQ